ncbi:MAG: radical SAM protein [Spirochaetes bacterium]|nr:radical SAM protein [Spirochaetota bacterium]
MDLLVHEIFRSIEGETTSAGFPALFVRLAGCNLHCRWCDTPEARYGGTAVSIASVMKLAEGVPVHHVTITGGEPLLQEGCITLMEEFLRCGFSVQLETNGSLDISSVPRGVRRIVDVKGPSSGEERSFRRENCGLLVDGDEVKFVIADDADYDFARRWTRGPLKDTTATVNFSPARGLMPPEELAGLILRDSLGVRLNLQLHGVLWGEREGKVVLPLAD